MYTGLIKESTLPGHLSPAIYEYRESDVLNGISFDYTEEAQTICVHRREMKHEIRLLYCLAHQHRYRHPLIYFKSVV